jgi:hypothetical protein
MQSHATWPGQKLQCGPKKALTFDADSCRYDVILGADFLSKTGIDVKCSTGTIEWFDYELPLHDTCYLQSKDFLAMAESKEIQWEVDFFGMDWYGPTCYVSIIIDAMYKKVLVDDVINKLDHLNAHWKTDLWQVLSEHIKLFDGTLGVYPHISFHIDLVPGLVGNSAWNSTEFCNNSNSGPFSRQNFDQNSIFLL